MVIGTILATGASLTAGAFVVQVAILPLVFKYSKTVQQKIVFSNCFNCPMYMDYENPSSVDIIGGRNFYIEFESEADKMPIKIGVWHLLPCSVFREMFDIKNYLQFNKNFLNQLRRSQSPIILYLHAISSRLSKQLVYESRHKVICLYLHGNANHRASPYRLYLYKIFQELNFHVITFDYRGYGDSTQVRPTEKGVVEDAFQVYSWLQRSVNSERRPMVVLWGHSLGAAVAANLVSNLAEMSAAQGSALPQPDALVLEAPFNNLCNEIEKHPCSKFFSWLPYFQASFVKPIVDCVDYNFATDEYIVKVPEIPILMMHSKCDQTVPYELAVKLHENIKESRSDGGAPVVFHTFKDCTNIGHNNLCQAKELKEVITNFLDLLEKESIKNGVFKKKSENKIVINTESKEIREFKESSLCSVKETALELSKNKHCAIPIR